MLRTIYAMLTNNKPYTDKTVDYEKQTVDRNAPRWLKKLAQYGYIVKPV